MTGLAGIRGNVIVTVFILMVFQALGYFDKQLFALLSAPIGSALKLSDVQLGLLQGLAFSVPYSLATLGLGWAADRYSPRALLFACVMVWSLSAMATGLVSSFIGLMFVRIALGLGEAGLHPAAYKIITRTAPPEKMATALSFYTSGGLLGSAAAMAGGGVIIASLMHHDGVTVPILGHLESWQAAFIILSMPGLLFAFMAFFLPRLPSERQEADRVTEAAPIGLFEFLRQRWFLVLCQFGTFSFLGMALFAALSWVPVYLTRAFEMPFGTIGMIIGISTAVSAICGTLWGFLSDWIRRRGNIADVYRLFMWFAVVGVPCQVLAFLVQSPAAFVSLYIPGVALFGAFSALAAVIPSFTPPHLIGRMYGIQTFVLGSLGAGLAPLIVAFLTERVFGDPLAVGKSIAITIAFCGAGVVVLLAAGRKALLRAAF